MNSTDIDVELWVDSVVQEFTYRSNSGTVSSTRIERTTGELRCVDVLVNHLAQEFC